MRVQFPLLETPIEKLEFFYEIKSLKTRFKHHPQGFKDDSNGIEDSDDDYDYDDFGNLIRDQNKQITPAPARIPSRGSDKSG